MTVKEEFSRAGGGIVRRTTAGSFSGESFIADPSDDSDPGSRWSTLHLTTHPEPTTIERRRIKLLDLFSGAGGLGFGAAQAAFAAGLEPHPLAAIDLDQEALEIYERNLDCRLIVRNNVSLLVDFKVNGRGEHASFDYAPEVIDPRLAARLGGAELLIAGPPCQGHSNLNNHTRRQDVRNLHYLAVPAFAVALNVPVVVIENVPEVLNDKHSVVESAIQLLRSSGYSVTSGIISALDFGVPQSRRRFFIVAAQDGLGSRSDSLVEITRSLVEPPRNVGDVIEDLLGREGETEFHTAARLSAENIARVQFLFDNGEYDLPDHVRPDCHKGGHTYKSVYGRLHWGAPSGTITSGFLTPGRGRFIHPREPRGLTPHEGARLQGFPDDFQFRLRDGSLPSKKTLSKVIGDAVPPRLGHVVTLVALAKYSAIATPLARGGASERAVA